MSTTERWLPIPGWPDYQASSLGRITSVKKGKFQVLRGGLTDTGYRNVLLYDAGQRSGRRVHSLVALAFHGPRPDGLEIRHLDGDQLNNAADNLRYGTHAENMRDRVKHGRHPEAAKTHCKRNHEFTSANTRRYRGGRFCRSCAVIRQTEYRQRQMLRAASVPTAVAA